jgi:hypothetical protein
LTYRALADLILGLHLAFVLFVVLGGLLVLKWPRAAWLHVPAAICPLTPLENSLRARGGEAGYGGGFIEHYIQPLLYPAGLTRGTQLLLGSLALMLNLTAYAGLFVRKSRGAR